jgi:filamentous hemagglutinin family protein
MNPPNSQKTNSIAKQEMRYIKFCIATTIILNFCITAKQLALADGIPDNSLGSSPSIVSPNQTVNGVDSEIVEGGARRGANLFHSFKEYSVSPEKGSYFLDPTGVKYIFVRVTGNSPSQIDGTIGVLGGKADLFLINPKGIHFSENSKLDLDGSFTATTADRLLFHGYEFSAYTPREVPTLAIEIPIGLEFNGGNGNITVNNKGFTIYAPSAGSSPPTALENPPLGLSVKPGNNLSEPISILMVELLTQFLQILILVV